MARTSDEWFNVITGDLAKPKAFVPITEVEFNVALSDALDIYGMYVPRAESRTVRVPDGLLVIDLSSEIDGIGVGRYRWADSTTDIHRSLTPFYPIQIIALSVQGPRFQFEINQTIERWSRLLGGKEDQRWDFQNKKLYAWNPRGQEFFTFEVMFPATLEDIPFHRYAIFRKLLRAKTRELMIQIFNRQGPLAGPEGNIETDMDWQTKKAETELSEVMPVLERMPEAMVGPRWD